MLLCEDSVYGVIYRVTNTENGMIYIGKTKNSPIERFNQTWQFDNTKYAKELRKYQKRGRLNVFVVETICVCFDSISLSSTEKEIIQEYYLLYPDNLYNTHIAPTYEHLPKQALIQKVVLLERSLHDVRIENEELKKKIDDAEHQAYLKLGSLSDELMEDFKLEIFEHYYEKLKKE